MIRRPVSALKKQAADEPLIPVSGPMPRRDRMLRDLGIREALELADDTADRIEATDPTGAALLRSFRKNAAATLIRCAPDEPRSTGPDQATLHPMHKGSLQ